MYERVLTPTAHLGTIPPGDRGTRATLTTMRKLVLEGARMPQVREAAIDAGHLYGAASHDPEAQLDAVFRFVRDRVTFVNDVSGVETVQSPLYTLHVMAGDCDDRATLLAALAMSIGIPADFKFRVIAANPAAPRSFSHVYVTAKVRGRIIALDPTYQSNEPGYQYPMATRTGDFAL